MTLETTMDQLSTKERFRQGFRALRDPIAIGALFSVSSMDILLGGLLTAETSYENLGLAVAGTGALALAGGVASYVVKMLRNYEGDYEND